MGTKGSRTRGGGVISPTPIHDLVGGGGSPTPIHADPFSTRQSMCTLWFLIGGVHKHNYANNIGLLALSAVGLL